MSRRSLAQWLSWQERVHPSSIDLGLQRIRTVLARLGWQQPAIPVITVGGTNGKGSTVALTAAMLAAGGYRVGTFTSPHLLEYNERITLAGKPVSDASLVAAFERIEAARGTITLTFFEYNALAALLIFDTAGLDALVLEVGLGGRLDAVNVVDADIAILTSVALDHCDWLGHDLQVIGREKAGIFRAGQTAIFGAPDMPESVAAVAQEMGARLLRLGVDYSHRRSNKQWDWLGAIEYTALPAPALHGDVQFDNAAAVLCALHSLRDRLPLSREAMERGLREVRLAGRLEIFSRTEPVAAEWIVDVAHNPAAARTLARQLAARPPATRTLAVCGILADKDIEGIAAELRDSFDGWIAAGLDGPRALAPEVLAQRFSQAGLTVLGTAADVAAGCELAAGILRGGERIVVFGSFMSAGPALRYLQAVASHLYSASWNAPLKNA